MQQIFIIIYIQGKHTCICYILWFAQGGECQYYTYQLLLSLMRVIFVSILTTFSRESDDFHTVLQAFY